MSSTTNNFNSAPQHSATETTAAQATAQAPNVHIAKEIQRNAETEQTVAGEAARLAKGLGPSFTGEVSTDQTVAAHEAKLAAERKTLNAVEQGKHDVDQAKTAASGYVETAKEYVNSAIETAQSYVPTAMGGKPADPNATTSGSMNSNTMSSSGPGIVGTIRNTATSVYTTAVETAQPIVNKVVSSAEGALGTAGLQGKNVADRTVHDSTLPTTTGDLGAKDAASTAPLQSGDKVVKGPYAEGVPSHEIGTNAPVRN